MEQEVLTQIIAENLVKYRKAASYTQSEIAEKLNYSDKSVSKWEQGNGMPDIFVLHNLAEIYGITVEDFLTKHENEPMPIQKRKDKTTNKLIVLMSVGLCWLVAVLVFVVLQLCAVNNAWLSFVYAPFVMFIVLVVFSCIWKFYTLRVFAASAVIWFGLFAIYLTVYKYLVGAYLLFLVGVPIQILVLIWFWFRHRAHKKKNTAA